MTTALPSYTTSRDVTTTVYHLEVHDGIRMAPARAWTAGKKRTGRPMVNDVRVLEKLFGRVTTATLTVKGITVDNMRFSDPRKVTGLLGRLLPRAPKRNQRKGLLSSGKVEVTITIYQWTAEHIGVWDPTANQMVDLPNVEPNFSAGQTWTDVKACKAFADRENLAFHSEEERCAARAALHARCAGNGRRMTRPERRVAVRTAATPREAEVRGVVQVTAPASHDGMLDCGVPVGMPANEMKGSRKPPKAPRRGGKLASKRAAEARKARNASEQDNAKPIPTPQPHASLVQTPAVEVFPSEADHERSDVLLDELENDLHWRY